MKRALLPTRKLTKVLVFARTMQDYQFWRWTHQGLSPSQFMYIGSRYSLRGWATGCMPRIYLPGWADHPSAAEIQENLRIADVTGCR